MNALGRIRSSWPFRARTGSSTDRGAQGEPTVGEAARPQLSYRPELDGLRAVAVGGVLLAHARITGEGAGHAGVTAFFVLSGYLITSLLIAERSRTGTIDLSAFYVRRIRRLAPALVAVLVFVVLMGIAGRWTRPWEVGVAGAASYAANWVRVILGPDSMGPLGHTWSLAVEEQFYLLWPLVFLRWPRQAVRGAVIWIALAPALRFATGGAFEEFSTLTRGDAILAGCLLAVSGLRFSARAGWIGLVALVASSAMSIDALLPVATIGSVLLLGSGLKILAPLAPIGKRAYGIYLWDYTLTSLIGPGVGAVAALGAAEISWRSVEARFRSASRHQLVHRAPEASELDRGDARRVVVGVAVEE